MHRQSIFRRTILVLSPILFLCAASEISVKGCLKTPPPPQMSSIAVKCSAITDAEIVAAIQEKIKADIRFKDQWKHINVSSRNRVVTLSGWARGPRQVIALGRFARATRCVRRVRNKLRFSLWVGCGAGQKKCGDTCIDRNEQCNLIQENEPPQ